MKKRNKLRSRKQKTKFLILAKTFTKYRKYKNYKRYVLADLL